jgi:hypothetical protein
MSARPPNAPSALKQIWLKWKTLRLPWRRQFLAGADLSGNTFWEFKDAMNAQRFRRIVKYSKQSHYADVKISRKSNAEEKRKGATPRFRREDGFANFHVFLSQQPNGINGSDTHATNLHPFRNRPSTSRAASA